MSRRKQNKIEETSDDEGNTSRTPITSFEPPFSRKNRIRKSKLRRSYSASHLLENNKEPITTNELVEKCEKYLFNVLKDTDSKLSESSEATLRNASTVMKQILESVNRNNTQIHILETALAKELEQRTKIKNFQQSIVACMPSDERIQELFKASIQEYMTESNTTESKLNSIQDYLQTIQDKQNSQLQLQKSINKKIDNKIYADHKLQENFQEDLSNALKEHIADTTVIKNQLEAIQESITTDLNNRKSERQREQQQISTKQQEPTVNQHNIQNTTITARSRTLVLFPKSEETSGKDLYTDIVKKNISTPAIIENIKVLKNKVEITCREATQAGILEDDILNADHLPETVSIKPKLPRLQRAILLGTAVNTTEEQIHKAMDAAYNYDKEEFSILRKITSRNEDEANWIILVVPALLKTIINDQGLFVGLSKCRIRPYTSVIRCRNCQEFGHLQKYCDKPTTCEICASTHASEQCQTEYPTCYNCLQYNEINKTTMDTCHKASSNQCPTYRELLSKERERLDAKFPIKNNRQNHKQQPLRENITETPITQTQDQQNLKSLKGQNGLTLNQLRRDNPDQYRMTGPSGQARSSLLPVPPPYPWFGQTRQQSDWYNQSYQVRPYNNY